MPRVRALPAAFGTSMRSRQGGCEVRRSSPRPRGVGLTVALAVAVFAVSATTIGSARAADPTEQITNGTFDTTTDPWWQANATIAAQNGELCATVPGGTVNPWDSIVGYNLQRLENTETYKLAFDAHASIDVQPRVILGSGQEPFPTYFETTPRSAPGPRATRSPGSPSWTTPRRRSSRSRWE